MLGKLAPRRRSFSNLVGPKIEMLGKSAPRRRSFSNLVGAKVKMSEKTAPRDRNISNLVGAKVKMSEKSAPRDRNISNLVGQKSKCRGGKSKEEGKCRGGKHRAEKQVPRKILKRRSREEIASEKSPSRNPPHASQCLALRHEGNYDRTDLQFHDRS